MKVGITGSSGFIGKNLKYRLKENKIDYLTISHKESNDQISDKISRSEFLVHLAGVNRPDSSSEFKSGNVGFTDKICDIIEKLRLDIPIIFSSSTQAGNDTEYGISKEKSEKRLIELNKSNKNKINIFRLSNIFGKWCKPNYNSVVATFCYNTSRGIENKINDPDTELKIIYIDDVIKEFLNLIKIQNKENKVTFLEIPTQFQCTLKELDEYIRKFKVSRETLVTENVGSGLLRALYATYLSYLPKESFSYSLNENVDSRGIFVEFLKTKDSGQFSYFTAYPGVTRGAHYHHSKTEKFLVVNGKARFNFKNIISEETFEITIEDKDLKVVESIPGWFHDITNIGEDLMTVFLWGSEIFDKEHPDTYSL